MDTSKSFSFLFLFYTLILPFNELVSIDEEKRINYLNQQPVTYTLRVEVVDWVTGDELANAQITVAGFSNLKATTNENGISVFENLEAGTYTIKVRHDGYKTWKKKIEIHRNKEIKIKLKPQIADRI